MARPRALLTAAIFPLFFCTAYSGMSLSCFVQNSRSARFFIQKKFGRSSNSKKRSLSTTTTFRKSPIVMMPEGPEVRTLVDQLQGGVGRQLVNIHFVSGRYVRNGPPDGFADFCATMSSRSRSTDADKILTADETAAAAPTDIIFDWNCKGKFIYIILDNGTTKRSQQVDPDFQRSIWITLGMTGRFVNEAANQRDSRHVRWYLELLDRQENQTTRIYYHDARNFGTLKFCLSRQLLLDKLQSLGPDILANTTIEDDFLNIISAQSPQLNICKFLMDQSNISGIGNYILSESLYRSGIDPFASLQELDGDQQRRLFREVKATSEESYQAQGMTREKGGQFRTVDGERGSFEFQLQCYNRETCARGKRVHMEPNGPHGRTIWYTDEQLFMPRSERMKKYSSSSDDATKTYSTVDPVPSLSNVDPVAAKSKLLRGLKEDSWKQHLSEAFNAESFQKLAVFLEQERARGATIYPPQGEIFSALNLCPFNRVKVVIVGQDPYHGPGQGHGLAFSVKRGVKAPPSLQNIFREVMEDVGIEAPRSGNLEHWARQGVLLLNAVLTVRQGEANSHTKKGWEEFTDAIIQQLNERRRGCVFLLWGNEAAKKASGVDPERHTIIRTSHPSPLGATKTASPFLGSRCFSRANQALIESGQDSIDWNVE